MAVSKTKTDTKFRGMYKVVGVAWSGCIVSSGQFVEGMSVEAKTIGTKSPA